MAVRVTQTFVERIVSQEAPNVRVTQTFVERIVSREAPNIRVTQVYVERIRSLNDRSGFKPSIRMY